MALDRRDRDFHGRSSGEGQRLSPPQTAPQAGGEDLEAYVRERVLLPGEVIAWRGRPSPAEALRGQLKAVIFAGAAFVIIPLVMMGMAKGAGVFEYLFMSVFIALGLWQLSRPWQVRWRAKRTYYAVTDKRVLIIRLGKQGSQLTSITPEQIVRFDLHDFGDGRGTVTLRETINQGRRSTTRTVEFEDALWGVDDFKGAVAAVQALLAPAQSPSNA